MSTPVITVENLSKKYILKHQGAERYTALRDVITNKAKNIINSKGLFSKSQSEDFWALNDVSFEVNQGDKVGIIGRNGAGKSTLLKILSRIVKPTTGQIIIDGQVASLLEVGTGFHPELTGRENIFLNGSILGMQKTEIKRKFDEIVAFAQVEKFLDTPVKRFSSGMYVRLAFSVAANLGSDILIVDEVLAVGDAEFQKKCLKKMEDVSGEGRTVIFVSHNIAAIKRLCNRGVFLQGGKVKSIGDIENIVASYIGDFSNSPAEYFFNKREDQIVSVTKFTIEDLNGTAYSEFPIGKSWRCIVSFSVNHDVKGLIIALGMMSPHETLIRTSWTLPEDFTPGEYRAIFTEDEITFAPGRYRLVVGVALGGTKSVEYLKSDMHIYVSAEPEDEEKFYAQNDQGVFFNPMQMSIEKA